MSSKENALSIANNIFHLLGTIEKIVGLNLPKPHNYMGIETQGSSVAPTIGLGKIIEEHSSLKEHPNVKLGLEVLEVVKMVVAEVAPLLMANEHLLVPIQTLGVLAAVTTQFINIVIMVETFIQEDSKGISEVVDFFKTVVTALEEKIAKIKSELQEIEKLFTVSKGSQSYISFEKHSVAVNTFTVKVACCQLEIEQCKSLIKSIIPKMTTTISQLSDAGKKSAVAAGVFAAATIPCVVATVVFTGGLAAIPAVAGGLSATAAGGFSYHSYKAFNGKHDIMKMRGELEKYLMDVEDCRIKLEQTISVQDM